MRPIDDKNVIRIILPDRDTRDGEVVVAGKTPLFIHLQDQLSKLTPRAIHHISHRIQNKGRLWTPSWLVEFLETFQTALEMERPQFGRNFKH